MNDLKTIQLDGKTYSVTPGSHAQDKNDPHEVTPAQIGAKAANTIETIAHGGTGANTAELALSNLSALHFNGNWQTAQPGISVWHYEVENTEDVRAQYNIPHGCCEILVMKRSANRGVALAFGWTMLDIRMWRSYLHDDTGSNAWSGWTDVRDAIDAAPAADTTLFRGTLTASDDWGTAKTQGRYWGYTWSGSGGSFPIAHDSGHLYVTVSELVIEQVYHSYNGYRCQRWYEKSSDTWSEWEWEIPPMQLGVEYRTTERWSGKVVYTKLVNCGALPAAGAAVHCGIGYDITKILRGNGVPATQGFTVPYISTDAVITVSGTVHNGRAYIVVYVDRGELAEDECIVQAWYIKD